ncbi:MAG: phosphonate ABC transporter, permease protein PhnE, partial [Proteobacteria bacterium]
MEGATRLTTTDILRDRKKNRVRRGIVYVVLLLLVAWSVEVTIIDDTDWERMGSLGKVLETAGRFVAVDWSLFPQLVEPAIETFMIACLGTLFGVLICIPAAWFGALNITPFKPVPYPIARLLMTLSRSI